MPVPSRVEDGRTQSPVITEPRNTSAIARSLDEWRANIVRGVGGFLGRQGPNGSVIDNPHISLHKSKVRLFDFTSDVFGKRAKPVLKVPDGLVTFLETSTYLTFLPLDTHDLSRFQDGTLEVDVEMPYGLRTKGFVVPQVGGVYRGECFQVMPDGSYVDIGGAQNFNLRELADTVSRPRKIY